MQTRIRIITFGLTITISNVKVVEIFVIIQRHSFCGKTFQLGF